MKETEASAPARKRARATKDEGNGKKNADGKEAQSKEDNEKKDLVNTDSVKYAEDAKEEAQEDAAPEVQGSKEDVNNDKSYWLMKAEPETRLEKGVDVRFSIDDLREAKEPEPWDGAFSSFETPKAGRRGLT